MGERAGDAYWRRAMALFDENTADLFLVVFITRPSRDLELGEDMRES